MAKRLRMLKQLVKLIILIFIYYRFISFRRVVKGVKTLTKRADC